MLGKAASMELASGWNGTNPTVEVTVTNETAHRLPSGYPEGRRIWIHVRAYDDAETLVYESGHWDPATGLLEEDPVPKVYHTEPGLSPGLAAALGLPAGPSFHFVLNDTVWFDNRIPPRGATNAELEAVQSPPVGYSYADSQYWDVTEYALPLTATHAEVELLYQTTSKEYVEFLRDENVTNDRGQDLYDAWVAQGRAAPIVMQSDTVSVMVPTSVASGPAATVTALAEVRPNPVREGTEIAFSLAAAGPARVAIFDVTGRRVRQIAGGVLEAGAHRVAWSGRDDGGRLVAAGLYWVRLETEEKTLTRKLLVVR
jgi:hypothetical protein